MKLKLIIIILVLSSCSSQWHLKKAIEKDPTILLTDTIRIKDTVQFITNDVRVDSVFSITHDTVRITKDKLKIKVLYKTDSIFVAGECESDTIVQIREVEVPCKQVSYKEKFIPDWAWVFIIIVCIILLVKKLFFTTK